MAHYYCVLLDLDGTLLDFDASEQYAINETFTKFEIDTTDENIALYKQINSALWQSMERGEVRQDKVVVKRFEKLLSALNKKGDPVRINDFYLTSLSKGAQLYDGAMDTLKALSEVATLAVVTNGVDRVQKAKIKALGLTDVIDEMFTSEGVGSTKPARKIFDVALRTMGVDNKKKVIMVGDSLSADIVGGKAAGIATCWCNFKNTQLQENDPKPEHTIYRIEELLGVVMDEEDIENAANPQKRHQV